MLNIIIGLFFGAAITFIFLDQENQQQSRLIEEMNRDLILEKQKVKHYRNSLRLERQMRIELLMKK